MMYTKKYSYKKISAAFLALCFAIQLYGQEVSSVPDIEGKVTTLLAKMTLEEKVGQMNQYNGFWEVTGPAPNDGDAAKKYEHLRSGLVGSMLNVKGVENVRTVQKIAVEETRLGIPLIIGFDGIHGYKTISPIPLAEAASWDLEAIKKSAEIAAEEMAAAGINWTFAPMVDISRDARWGRVMEGAGEDPYLGSKIAIARVKGFQGDDLSSHNTIAACAKHFAGYGFSESGKDYNTVDIGNYTLYNMVFPPFEAAKEAGVRTFMNAFNVLDGIPATGNTFLQRDILKDKWGFNGFIVSDWGSITEMIAHGYAENGKEAARMAANAGSDMDMESYHYVNELVALVKEGSVDEKDIDDAVRRILRVKFELGLFDNPYKYCDSEREKEIVGKKEYQDTMLDIAKKSIVLLKNDNNLLPLQKKGQKIALIGDLAGDKNSPLGSWRLASDDHSAISVLEGMQAYKGNDLTYTKGASVAMGDTAFVFEVKVNEDDMSAFAKAISTAKEADVVVMVLGEHGFQTGEGRSRAQIDLPGVQQELLEAIYAVNKNIVLILNNGRPLAIDWAAQHIPAIVEGWHLGSQSGNAIAQVLYGDYNPSGKLPMSFPRSVGQLPLYYNHMSTGRPNELPNDLVFWTHYSDESNDALYPFGYGLSYTQFKYTLPTMEKETLGTDTVKVQVTIQNTGKVAGREVVQLYIRDKYASVARPVKELKGFQTVALSPGESKTIIFELTDKELGFYNNRGEWMVEDGSYEVYIGGNSATSNKTEFELKRGL